MHLARCDRLRHNLFCRLIDTQMQLPPGSAPTMPMLSDMPLTRSVVSQARAVDNHLPRSAGRANSQDRRQGTLSSTESAVGRATGRDRVRATPGAKKQSPVSLADRDETLTSIPVPTQSPCRRKPSERRDPWVGRRSAKRRRCPHRIKRSVAPCRSAPDRSLSSCTLGNRTCIDSASFLMLAPWPIGDKPIPPKRLMQQRPSEAPNDHSPITIYDRCVQ